MAASLLDIPGYAPGRLWLAPGTGTGLSNSSFFGQTPAQGLGDPSPIFNPYAAHAAPNTPNALGMTASGNTAGPFTAETLTRNPELAAILKKLYGDIGNISTNPNVNQTVLQRNTKLPEVEAAGQAALTQQQADAHNNAQSIADFAKSWLAAQPAAQARADQEAANIGRVQSGALASDLAANQRSSDISSTQNLMRRLGALAGTQNLGDLSRGGVTNSNANANILQAAANASLARDAASLAGHRQNIMDVQNLQIGTAGLPQRILDAVLQRQLTPIQARQASSAADLNQLQGVSGLLMGNNLFTPQSRAGLVGQNLGLAQLLANLRKDTNYDYVRGDFPNQLPGVVPQRYPNFPNPNTSTGNNGQMLQQILDSLRGGGSDQPSISMDELTPVTRYPPGYNRNPFRYPAPGQGSIDRENLIHSFTNPDTPGAGYSDDVIRRWLSGLSPEQLSNVPAGGYE